MAEFQVDDIVTLSFGFLDLFGSGNYEVLRVMPASERGESQYRVRGSDGHERAVGGHQIRPATRASRPLEKLT